MAFSIRQKQDGAPYPPRTLHQILAGLQRHTVEILPSAPKFLDRANPVYRDSHRACVTVYRELHGQGVGTTVLRSLLKRKKSYGVQVSSLFYPLRLYKEQSFSMLENTTASEAEKNRDDLVLHSSFDLVTLIVI